MKRRLFAGWHEAERRWPRRLASAPSSIDTVAAAPGRRVRPGEARPVATGPCNEAPAVAGWHEAEKAVAPPAGLGARVDRYRCCRAGKACPSRRSPARRHGPVQRSAGCSRDGMRRERRWPRRLASAPASIDTVAAFRPWRDFRSSVARGRRGHHRDEAAPGARPFAFPIEPAGGSAGSCEGLACMAERGGFEPPKRGLDAYTLSRRAPSTTRTPLRTWGADRHDREADSTGPGRCRQAGVAAAAVDGRGTMTVQMKTVA